MRRVIVVGAGPAGVASAILLKRLGYDVEVVGPISCTSRLEGLSPRVLEGFRLLGCQEVVDAMGPMWSRTSLWGGNEVEVNGEYVTDRAILDSTLIDELESRQIDHRNWSVRHLEFKEGGCVLTGDDPSRTLSCDFIVDARGRTAPKRGRVLAAGPANVALAQRARIPEWKGQRKTLIEPFESGWAWSSIDRDGVINLQIFTTKSAVESLTRSNLSGLYKRLCRRLPQHSRLLSGATPLTQVSVRGCQSTLRSNIIGPGYICIGDAAMTVDPLSGHGIFEALSSAFAAVPVINTVLQHPEREDLARNYYRSRASSIFKQRKNSCVEISLAESRWQERPFWLAQQEWTGSIFDDDALAPGFVSKPVVENNLIVERSVFVGSAHPRGVRFVDEIDLHKLYSEIKRSEAQDFRCIAEKMGADQRKVATAYEWLKVNGSELFNKTGVA